MKWFLSFIVVTIYLVLGSGCAMGLEETNKGAEEVGKPVGKVMRIPTSAAKGAAEGVAGEPEPNPYDR